MDSKIIVWWNWAVPFSQQQPKPDICRVLDLDQPGLGMAREYLMKGVEDSDVKVGVNIFYNLHLIIFDEGSRGQGCNGWCKYILQFTSYLTKEGGRVCLHFIVTS